MSTVLDLTQASTLTGSEIIYCAQSGSDYYLTPSMLADYVLGNVNTAEFIRDTIGATLVAGTGISIVVDDSPNTITISSTSVAAWGSITGTLSAQTDLQSALNAKQATLVSATNIKTVNGTTLLGSGDLSTTQTTITGNAGTATALQTARTINGTSFDGTANITVTAAAGTLTGSTLASGVTASSLTSVGTLTSLAVAGTGTITSTSATALAVGANGATTPVLQVDASTASQASGIAIKGLASGAGVTITAIGGTNEPISIIAKGSASAIINGGTSANLQASGSNCIVASATNIAFTTPNRNATANTAYLFTALASGAGGNSLTAGSEVHAVYFNLSSTQTHGSTTGITTQRDLRINPHTHAYQTATGTITDAIGVGIDGAPIAGTNCSITTSTALNIQGRAVGSGVTTSYGLQVAPNTGATNNYAARFTGETQFTAALQLATVGKTASFTADNAGTTYRCDATSGAIVVTLPSASACSGRIYAFKKTDSGGNSITFSASLDGNGSYSLATQYKYVVIQSNGTTWDIIGNN